MRPSQTRQRQLALVAEYREQRQHYKKEQEHVKRAREAKAVGRFYDRETEKTYEVGERIPAADTNACVPCGGKRKSEATEEITHQHKRLKINTSEMSPSRETKEHLEGIKVRRQEGQSYQGTARQGEGRRDGQEKPKNPYSSLKAAKRKGTSKAAVDSPRKAAAKRAERAVESRRGRPEHETVAKKATVPKEAATSSNIYKRRKVVAEAKADAVVNTKSVEREARLSSGRKRKAADALDGDAAQPAVHGDDEPSAKKRRTEDEPVVETEPSEEEATARSKNVKTEEDPSPPKPAIHPGNLSAPKAPMKGIPNFSKSSGWGRASQITRETVTVKKSPTKGGSSGKRKRN